jgi:hypothetical protein
MQGGEEVDPVDRWPIRCALVQDIVGEAMRGVGSGRDTTNKERIAQKYNHMVLNGKLRTVL